MLNQRKLAVATLVSLIKGSSTSVPRDFSNEAPEINERSVLNAGLGSLRALGVREEEILEAIMVIGMGDVEDVKSFLETDEGVKVNGD